MRGERDGLLQPGSPIGDDSRARLGNLDTQSGRVENEGGEEDHDHTTRIYRTVVCTHAGEECGIQREKRQVC